MNEKNLYFKLDDKDDRKRFAFVLSALNESGITYEVRKGQGDDIAIIEIGEGY